MSKTVENLLQHSHVFRFKDVPGNESTTALATGFSRLDEKLPTHGWPRGALTEIAVDCYGTGELQLVMPALSHLSHEGAWITWISPPYVPYPPALFQAGLDLSRMLLVRTRRATDALWATEQALRSGSSAATLLWADNINDRRMRRLQLAAAEGNSWGVIFRPTAVMKQPSPASLRIMLFPDELGIHLHVVKMRGGKPFSLRLKRCSTALE